MVRSGGAETTSCVAGGGGGRSGVIFLPDLSRDDPHRLTPRAPGIGIADGGAAVTLDDEAS